MLAGVVLGGWLLYQLAPILSPFLVASLLAYLGDPLVDRLVSRRLPRTLATATVLLLIGVLVLLVPLLLLPVLQTQIEALLRAVPEGVAWITAEVLPWIKATLGIELALPDTVRIKKALTENWQEAGSVAVDVVGYVSRSGLAVIGWLASIVLVPVVTFYMLRDWDILVERIRDLLPRAAVPTLSALARESDDVLSAFLRGQLMVMLCLAVIYSVGLWLAGLQFALVIGLLAGLASFVPYLGVIVGLVTAAVATLIQSQDVLQLVWVFVVFGVGQLLEGMVLTPWLVGDRIGLHPVAVIFAVLAGGQLFGFIGVLLALPVAAVLAVLARHARARYRDSAFYADLGEDGPDHGSVERQ
jgi:predicted PurR-regulated permease PerM